MKKVIILGFIFILLIPLLTSGCASKESVSTTTDLKTDTLEITLDEFSNQKSILKYVEMAPLGTLTVRLGSNPTTGYDWGDAEITHPDVIKQISRDYEGPPDTGLVGAGGTEVWVFHATDTGLAMIKMSYEQPWAGGEKDAYTVTININVK